MEATAGLRFSAMLNALGPPRLITGVKRVIQPYEAIQTAKYY